jgi:phage repressor protein C with HTH and peptisase S24 domain
MFVAQVVGRSMEPRIPDGSWCLFQAPVEGSRQGRIVLVQHRGIDDPETGGSYTVKRYRSEKGGDGAGSWRHAEIRLEPLNPGFSPLILRDVRDDELRVVAELVEVLRADG